MSLLEAISPTSAALLNTQFFAVGYAWTDKTFGELTGHTVTDACDEETALARFRRQHPHITRAWIIKGK